MSMNEMHSKELAACLPEAVQTQQGKRRKQSIQDLDMVMHALMQPLVDLARQQF